MATKRFNPSSITTTTTDDCSRSPEFEFWILRNRNPSFPQPHIHSADELFVDGVLLPLHLLPTPPNHTPTSQPPPPDPDPDPAPAPSPSITDSAAAPTLSASKRWKDIFRKSTDKKNPEYNNNTEDQNDKEKSKHKRERKATGTATTNGSAAELNINIWPFSRSRSAGNAATRPKLFPGAPTTRKANSAPCSRSNSAGESKSRKWPSSPGRAGLHIGRSSPVWQVRRGGSASSRNPEPLHLNAEKLSKKETSSASRRSKMPSSSAAGGGGSKSRVLNLNVPTCIGYRTNLSCRNDINTSSNNNIRGSNSNSNRDGNSNSNGVDGSSSSSSNSNRSNAGGKLFTLRSLFTKKTLLTSH